MQLCLTECINKDACSDRVLSVGGKQIKNN